MTDLHTFVVTVKASSVEAAYDVMRERLDHDEDGFPYRLDWNHERQWASVEPAIWQDESALSALYGNGE